MWFWRDFFFCKILKDIYMSTIIVIVTGVVGIGIGVLGTYVLFRKNIVGKSQQLLKDAAEEAELIKKEKMLQAKEKFLQMKSEHEKAVNEKNKAIAAAENRIKQKEQTIGQRQEALQRKQTELQQQQQ